MRVTVLGCGGSGGVPLLGNDWGSCDPANPRNRRRRVSVLVEVGGASILVDTSPDLRMQLLDAGVSHLDAVLFTHDHADHTHGIDDLRSISVRRGAALPIYGPGDALERIAHRFPYIFDDQMRPLPGTSKPEGHAHALRAGEGVRIGDVDVTPVAVPHGPITVFAYRIGPLAYVTDAKRLPPAAGPESGQLPFR